MGIGLLLLVIGLLLLAAGKTSGPRDPGTPGLRDSGTPVGEDLGTAVRTVGRTEAVRGPSRTRPF
ncbi:hypothetical protein [Streptomyces sp. NPDC093795]|uniref:hypothetical protein n=1 Tax=Streptomyces sp. NPDC093795 TaxID=3366051 RepID=UPI0037F50137